MNEDHDEASGARRFEIDEAHAGMRLDKGLSALCDDLSRTRIQGLLQEGQVALNGAAAGNASAKLQMGDVLVLHVPEAIEAVPQPEDIALDIVYEDEDMLVINKPAGLVVHPGAGNYSGTLVNALLHHCKGSLSGIGGVMRPGIVHRLDKDTSGLMVAAKNDLAHQGLSAQLQDRSLSRVYHALVLKVPLPVKGVVDLPIGRDPRHRLKMAIKGQTARDARTYYHVLEDFKGALSLVECKLETGRTHQIRVHMQAIKNPLIGDPLYGPQANAVRSVLKKSDFPDSLITQFTDFPRQALHAKAITFIHPRSEEEMYFESDHPEDFAKVLENIKKTKFI